MNCPLCDRELIEGPSVNAHHLIPKLKKGTIAEPCHVVCHRAIHANYTERELEVLFDTWAKLRVAPKLQGFLKWIRSKPVEFIDHMKESRTKTKKRR